LAFRENLIPFSRILNLNSFLNPITVSALLQKNLIKHNTRTLEECRTIPNKGEIGITPLLTVSELEQRFQDVYGLGVQVLRKSGRVWLETTVTYGWTIEQQNN